MVLINLLSLTAIAVAIIIRSVGYEPLIVEEIRDTSLLSEYHYMGAPSSYCADRYTQHYLENFQNTATEYCSPGSTSGVTCFHSQTHPNKEQVDSFCIGRSAAFNLESRKFHLNCNLRDLNEDEVARGIPHFTRFPVYWYHTGPRVIFEAFIHFDAEYHFTTQERQTYTILVKREGSTNPWHSLVEIFSMTLTIDILQMTPDGTGSRLFSEGDFEYTQVIILDSQGDGPYFDLWGLFSKKPIKRIHEITDWSTITPTNIIIPLAGSSNPLWQGDWGNDSCQQSDLLEVFSRRIVDFYRTQIGATENTFDIQAAQDSSTILLTYIDRQQKRRLIDHEEYLREVQERFPYVKVQIVDFSSIPFKEQIRIAQRTDILVGVHGVELSHAIFLKPQSVVVEILPSSCNLTMFQHLSRLRGHTYYSTHGAEVEFDLVRRGWDLKDVSMSKGRFLKTLKMAIEGLSDAV
ncbi:conserved hypothetical protein [Talaromyces stipitatus ATCC 10500]|uniref:EGF domain-specific O-linked N-acetylglucosamine transferase n=1 Tax=Talaromyces stipitatus (strain ATCC 10500 / CBS 375.48 / QM 6759 / NRRL 1006) TaxID=441959 RepID=B8MU97_TALSN|nr:uncharacterized protein TSTA_107920 [Talaromyces stipitatus ATCC 10500]EED11601.1 conserved hypothetical protein [Talaromyces stipitatus ATCC 10500]